jgi:hypothetical protein
VDLLFFRNGTEAADLDHGCQRTMTHTSYQLQAPVCERADMTRMVMMWMFGVPLSVLVLFKVFGIL